MNIIYNLAFLLLFQFSSCSDRAQPNNQQNQKRDKTGAANIVFKSTDGGQTWQDISDGLPVPLKDDSSGGRDVFFADDTGLWLTDGNGIYHSKPNFTAPFWNKEIFPNEHSSIAPGKAGIFAYNYHGGGIFQKINGTGVWSPVFTNFLAKRVFSVSETAGGTIFIGSDRGLFKSTNSGTSWKQLHAPTGGKIVESNAVLLASCQRGILRSTDDGESWALVISEGGVGIDIERIEGGFAAINYSTVAKTRRIRTSYNGGQTWQAIDAGLLAHGFIDPIMPPANANLPAQGFSDSTRHAKDATVLQMPTYITTIIQVGENFFCGHTDGIYRSSDNGKTWKLVHPSVKGKMFILSVSGNVIYALQTESHC
ncbi:MAG: glycosyl hydrolase repeat-containing protein [Ferruginibacter sp.]|nr:glycosyl hydrolase repeat-containing protein [Ferruginibacter sp.]